MNVYFGAAGLRPGIERRIIGPHGFPVIRAEIQRIEIQAGVHANESLRSIGRRLGRAASSIKREIDKNTELRTRKNPHRSGYRRKHAFGARQSGATAVVQYRAMAAHDRSADRGIDARIHRLGPHVRLAVGVDDRPVISAWRE